MLVKKKEKKELYYDALEVGQLFTCSDSMGSVYMKANQDDPCYRNYNGVDHVVTAWHLGSATGSILRPEEYTGIEVLTIQDLKEV